MVGHTVDRGITMRIENDGKETWLAQPKLPMSSLLSNTNQALKGGDRTHSLAMSKEYMEKMFKWSEGGFDWGSWTDDKGCRLSFQHVSCRVVNSDKAPWVQSICIHGMDSVVKVMIDEFWCAWHQLIAACHGDRNFELIKLKKKDLNFVSESNVYGLQYIELLLANHKGWQKRLDKGIVETDLQSVLHSQLSCHT
jgi:hypothetical protein